MQLVYHVTTVRNLKRIRNEGLFPRVGGNARAAGERRQAIYCFRSQEDADNALNNWLGESFDEPLAVLKINIDQLHHEALDHEWETRVFEHIAPNRILEALDDYGKPLALNNRSLTA